MGDSITECRGDYRDIFWHTHMDLDFSNSVDNSGKEERTNFSVDFVSEFYDTSSVWWYIFNEISFDVIYWIVQMPRGFLRLSILLAMSPVELAGMR